MNGGPGYLLRKFREDIFWKSLSRLLAAPGGAASAVFQHNTHGCELVARCIGCAPVFCSTGIIARFDKRFDFRYLVVIA